MHEKLAVRKGGFDAFLEEQKRGASGQRLEMLGRDLTGTRKLAEEVLLPVFGSLEGFVLEYEAVSLSGVRMYIDAFYKPLQIAFESDGYVSHAEKITRDRFSFERARIRTITIRRWQFMPFSWDELDKRPEVCRQALYELLGRLGRTTTDTRSGLSVYERELLRMATFHQSVFQMPDVCAWLDLKHESCRKVLRLLVDKNLIQPVGGGEKRRHAFQITEQGRQQILGM